MLNSLKCSLALALAAFTTGTALAQQEPARIAKPPMAVTARKVAAPGARLDIVETAVKSGSFKTLTAALQHAGLDETLKGKGPFTVFAPTDEAFAKLPEGTLEMLLQPANKKKLAAILTYHVVPGNVKAADAVKLESAKTVNGESLTITTEGDAVLINGARVTKSDVDCKNGTIHVIDTVLMPQE